jgi:UrcA family protein
VYSKLIALIASATLTATGLAVMASPVHGQAPLAAEGNNVAYSDIDLTSIAGEKSLRARVKAAVRRSCGYSSETYVDVNCRNARSKSAESQIARAVQHARETRAPLITPANIAIPK